MAAPVGPRKVLTSRDNPRVRRWARLAQDARYRRSESRALIEGSHLLAAALQHGHKPVALLATEEGAADAEIGGLIARSGLRATLLAEAVFRGIVDADNPRGLAAEIEIPEPQRKEVLRTVFLEGVQDPGNVGAIVRSAAAFGAGRVVLDRGCADAWSPRALRAGMGGHFAVALEQLGELGPALGAFGGKLVCAVPRGGVPLRQADLAGRIGWIFGGEGRGVSPAVEALAKLKVTISILAGTESLNVAAAAAICLYEGFSKPAAGS